MLADEIKLGNRIEITKKSNQTLKKYISVVENNFGDNKIRAYVPISYGTLVKLSIFDTYSMLFFTDKGMYRFKAKVVEYIKQDGFDFMDIVLLDKGEKIQRRSYYRFECMIGLKFEKITEDNKFEVEADLYKKLAALDEGIIKDLSGGGIKFITNVALEEGERIKMLIILNDEYIVCKGEIIAQQRFSKSEYKYQYRVKFVEIKDTYKECIVKYIFQQQRKIARKRSGL